MRMCKTSCVWVLERFRVYLPVRKGNNWAPVAAALWRGRPKHQPGRLSAAGVRSGSAGQGPSYTRAHRLARSTTRVRSAMPPADWAAYPKDAFPADASAANALVSRSQVHNAYNISPFPPLPHFCGNNAHQISPFPSTFCNHRCFPPLHYWKGNVLCVRVRSHNLLVRAKFHGVIIVPILKMQN